MRLTDASVAIRPRNPWEAIDLGVLLAREHRGLLMASWAVVTLPVFALLCLALWDYPSVAVFLFWWLKPAYERLPLLILSQALFGSTPTLAQALKAYPQALKPQLLQSLTWRRLSLSRSFKLPVQQLEGLSGHVRAQRIAQLSQKDLRAARALTSMGSTLELCLWAGLMVLLYVFTPQQVGLNGAWLSLLNIHDSANWPEHLTNAFYALVLVLWGPIYVSCGFTLYLNRRTWLEAWDIELAFRRLRQRLMGSAYALLLGLAITLCVPSTPAMADDAFGDSGYSCPLPPLDSPSADEQAASPYTPRLVNQALTSQASQNAIKAVLDSPPFKNPKTVSGWRIPVQQRVVTEQTPNTPDWLLKLPVLVQRIAAMIADALAPLLWTSVAVLLGWLIWRYRVWMSTFVSRHAPTPPVQRSTPTQLFGLPVAADSLPEDVATAAEQLWRHSPREALSLLYRALLSRLLTDYQLPLKNADTEGQVLERVATLNQPALDAFSQDLTHHWQNLAYGHRLPTPDMQQTLCEGWRRLFAARAAR